MKIHLNLMASKNNFSWHEFNAQHAFMRDEGERYDPALALRVYGMAVELFKRTL
jgi:carboxymethylenebutenolidase